MTERTSPNFAALLAQAIMSVAEPSRPRFLALLERTAAERYRQWAVSLPAHAAGLLDCSAREEEIADRVERAFALEPDARAELDAPLKAARETYQSVLAGLSLRDQLRLQAGAERQGAAAWRGMASRAGEARTRAELEHCARLEEASADHLDALVARL